MVPTRSSARTAGRRVRRACTLALAVFTASALVAGSVAGAPAAVSAQTTGPLDADDGISNQVQPNDEPNDDFDNATPLASGVYAGLAIAENDIDVYAVDLDAGESLSAGISFSHAQGDLDAALIDSTGTRIVASSESSTDDEQLSFVAPQAGTYYLVVYGYEGATGAYEMTVTTSDDGSQAPGTNGTADEFEPNDDFDSAEALGSGAYEDLSISPGDLDFYAVDLDAGESLSAEISFSHAEGDLDMSLVEPTRQRVVASSDSTTDDENLTYVAPEAGTYYLVVYGYRNASASYDLTRSPTPGVSANETTPSGKATQSRSATQPGRATQPDDSARSGAATVPAGAPADPATDTLGWENGYWANETIEVDQSDGLAEGELDAIVSRAMARVETIRRLEFERTVDVSVHSRAALARQLTGDPLGALVRSGYYNQLFEAMFMVDERSDAYRQYVGGEASVIGGYYAVGQDRLVVVAEDPDAPIVDEYVLVHELTHAAQDQHFDLEARGANVTTLDQENGWLGLIEGDANHVAYRYLERCGGEWQCVESPRSTVGGGSADSGNAADSGGAADSGSAADSGGATEPHVGLYLGGYQPYSDGPALISELLDRDGGDWGAVDAAYENPPVSSEQVISPERYPDERPTALPGPATEPRGEWERFGVERVGEAWLYAMLFYQGAAYDISVVDRSTVNRPDAGPDDTYNYTSAPSDGWGNDELRLYTDGQEYAYTWTLTWDSEADAREFHDAYLEILAGHGAQQRDARTWVVPDSEPYADAFSVSMEGRTVTIVNAPDVDALDELARTVDGSTANETTAG